MTPLSRIHYSKPSITELEVSYATDAARNGWGERCYDYIVKFENLFKEHLGVSYAIATSSCTGALHMGMAALGVGPGDEVILGDTNWIASASTVVHLGATPVFVDVLEDSWCIDPQALRKAIGARTKAIIATHIYGNLCEMDELLAIGREFNLPVIEDAAEAVGSHWKGHKAGTLGVFGTFSFHGTKTLTTGEGGLFVTNDESLYSKVLCMSNHGRTAGQTRQFWPEMIGFKYKMSNVQAAIGCGQLERIDDLICRKREIFNEYSRRLSDLPLVMNPEAAGCQNGYWMPTIVVKPECDFSIDQLLAEFKRENIDGRVFFWPISMLPMFEDKPENTVSYGLYPRAVNLPSYHDMTSNDIERVCAVVARCLLPAKVS